MTTERPSTHFARRIRDIQAEHGWSLRRMAAELRISPSSLSQLYAALDQTAPDERIEFGMMLACAACQRFPVQMLPLGVQILTMEPFWLMRRSRTNRAA